MGAEDDGEIRRCLSGTLASLEVQARLGGSFRLRAANNVTCGRKRLEKAVSPCTTDNASSSEPPLEVVCVECNGMAAEFSVTNGKLVVKREGGGAPSKTVTAYRLHLQSSTGELQVWERSGAMICVPLPYHGRGGYVFEISVLAEWVGVPSNLPSPFPDPDKDEVMYSIGNSSRLRQIQVLSNHVPSMLDINSSYGKERSELIRQRRWLLREIKRLETENIRHNEEQEERRQRLIERAEERRILREETLKREAERKQCNAETRQRLLREERENLFRYRNWAWECNSHNAHLIRHLIHEDRVARSDELEERHKLLLAKHEVERRKPGSTLTKVLTPLERPLTKPTPSESPTPECTAKGKRSVSLLTPAPTPTREVDRLAPRR
eukprot:Sspe_Gene.17863::Locus_6383_Transcript_1_1_Confidence_1.000_Length_1176::g.17863::m.17863